MAESLEHRRLLVAATDLASIVGQVQIDTTTGSMALQNISLDLFQDDGDGVFEPGAGDNEVRMTMTNSSGRYEFNRLEQGSYFVLQPAQNDASGRSVTRQVSPLITIDSDDVRGTITTTIDSFDLTPQDARDETQGDGPVVSVLAATEAIGEERELIVDKESANGAVQLNVDNPLLPNQLTFDSISTGQGPRTVVWDGDDADATDLDDTGLAGVDLTTNAEGIQLQIRADLAGGTATIRVYSDDGVAGTATRFSSASIPIPATMGAFLSAEFLPFADFTAQGGGADFTDVGAIELEINGAADVNGAASIIGAVGTNDFTANFENDQSADLSLTKTVNNPTPGPNEEVTFTVTATNAGPNNATGLQVSDSLPTGITFSGSTPSTGSYDPGSGVWTIGNLASGASTTLLLRGTVNQVGNLTNTAQVSAVEQPDPDSTPGNDIETEDDQASASIDTVAIDLDLTKTVDDATPNVGQNITFTLTLRNDGPDNASGIQVRDVLPAGLSNTVGQSPTPSVGNYNTTSGIWTVPGLAVGQSATLTIPATVNSTNSITNTAEVIAAGQFDIDSTAGNSDPNEDDQASITITAETADLSVTKTVDNSRPNVGQQVVYTVMVTNDGPDAATGVVVEDLLPTGLTSVSSTSTPGTYNAGTGLWTVGTLNSGQTGTLTIRANVESSVTNVNTAQVRNADQFDPDSTPGNSVEVEDDQASVTIDPLTIDLSLSKTIDNSVVDLGDEVVYTVTLSNAGPDLATGIIVSDTLPAGVTFLGSTPATGTYTAGTGNWTVGNLAAGSSTTLMLRGRVDLASPAVNTAEVIAADQFDSDSTVGNSVEGEDDQASIGFTIASADLSITKTVDDETPNIGENVTFTVAVSNAGPNVATGIAVQDQLPAGIDFVQATPASGSYDQTTGRWTVGSLAVGGTTSLTIVGRATTENLATNTAEIIAADQQDPDSTPGTGPATEDDIASAQIRGQQVDLSLTKTASDTSPNVGDEVTFTITIRNDGPSVATGVNVTDQLPPGISLVRSLPSSGSFNTATGVWTAGTLSVAQSETLQLVTRIDQVIDSATNTAEISSVDQPDLDSTPGNNIVGEDDQASVTFRTPVADLSLEKTVSNAAPNVGETVTFNVTLMNDGPDIATGVQVLDRLPEGLDFVSTTLNAGTYQASTGIWDVGTLASGASANLSIIANVDQQGTFVNTARVDSVDQADPDSVAGNDNDTEDDQDSATLTVPVIDLSIEKTSSPDRPIVGQNVTFSVAISNAGPNDASGVVVQDLLPDGLTFVGATTAVGNYDAVSGRWTIGDLPMGATQTLEIEAVVDEFREITNVAEVIAADQFDIDSTPNDNDADQDDRGEVTVTPASADLSITKTIDNAMPNFGSDVTFTITLMNDGPDDAAEIVVRDLLPAGIALQSSVPSAGGYDPATGNWTVPVLASGQMATLDLVAEVQTQTDRTNVAEIIASNQFDPDSVPADGAEDQDDRASVSLSPQLVDLALTKVVDNDRPNVGDSVEYLLTVTNDGPSTATGVVVTDRLPTGVTFEDVVISQGSYDPLTGVWTVGTINDDADATIRIGATVGNLQGVTNTAEITAADQVDLDSTPGNSVDGEDDQASVTISTQVADLSLMKAVDNSTPNQADQVGFTVSLRNDGPDDATGVVVRDAIPAGLALVSAMPSTGTYDSALGTWSIPNVVAGTTVTLRLLTEVQSGAVITNIAEVIAADQFDPDSIVDNGLIDEDDQAAVSITPRVADIRVSASVDNNEPLEDEIVTLTFTAENEGTLGATGIVANALIPAGLEVVSSMPSQGLYEESSGRWSIGTLDIDEMATLVVNARVVSRGGREVPIQIIAMDQFDRDSTPANNEIDEDDQEIVLIQAPRVLTKRLFLAR